MSLKNSQESYINSESEITRKETNSSEKKYDCDADCVCERCSVQKKLMREITDEINEINEINTKNKTFSECSNELIKDTIDSLLSLKGVIDFHYNERLENAKDKLSSSEENATCEKENENNIAQHYEEPAIENDPVSDMRSTKVSFDSNADAGNESGELSSDLNVRNEVKGYFSNFKAKYDDMVFSYVGTQRGQDEESHCNFGAKREGREYSCNFIGENKLRIFSSDLSEESRYSSANDCRNFSSKENADREYSDEEDEQLSLLNSKVESGSRKLPLDLNAGKKGWDLPTDLSTKTELDGVSRDLHSTTKSREKTCENREFAVDRSVDSATDGKTFFVHFKAGKGGTEVSRGVIEEKDLQDGSKNYSCECNAFEESSNASTEIYDFSNIPDCRRTRRCSKRKRDVEDFCPICGVTVRCTDLTNHFEKEVENLSRLSKGHKKYDESQGISTTYIQVRSNRENRHAAKVTKYSRSRNDVYCPVCNFRLTGTQDEINSHVLQCITDGESNEVNVLDNNVDYTEYDDENSFEEYEFGDQTRIRAISLVPGGYRSLHGDSSRPRRSCNDDEEGDLNVDVDDTLAYGNPQYTELDVIHNENDSGDNQELEQLRKAVLMDPSAERHVIESRKWVSDSDETEHPDSSNSSSTKANDDYFLSKAMKKKEHGSCMNKEAIHIISSLKEKIKDFDEENSSIKCLICLEPYTKPVVSTTCWHVHCEECWLMTMGVKKLCPQCNMIVFPSDLRRIYL